MLPASPAPDLATKIRNLQDTLRALTLNGPPQTLAAAGHALGEIHRIGGELVAWLPADIDIDGELSYWAQAFDRQSRALRDELRILVPDPLHFSTIPTLAELAGARRSRRARERLGTIDALMERCRALAAMDFEFLYDAACGLLTIGYDVGERRRDPACYDLLASEARLASFLLIAQGQVPQKHWFALGRLLTSHGGDVSLISWSGSMFEYLMPLLMMPSYANTLLEQTCKAAVSRQIEYGRQRDVPWGISESCYNATDVHQVYQYRAFGVPGLGFKRGLGDDLVIAPYASALALMVMPREACRNLQTLAGQGFLGAYGFYEAIDYTPVAGAARQARTPSCARFMAHHQGMSLLALCACVARPADAAPLHVRPARAGDRIAAAGAGAEAGRHPAPARGRSERRRAPARRGSRRDHARVYRPEHADSRGSPAVQRPLPRHGDPCRRRLQPLARPGRHPLARGRHLRWLGHLHLPARPRQRALLVDRAISRRCAVPITTRRSSCRRAPNTGGATRRSKRTPRSACRPKTTSRSAASRSPTSRPAPATSR